MNAKTFTIMGVIAVVLAGAALWVSQHGETTPPGTGQPVFPGLMAKINDVAEIGVSAPRGTITIVRKGESWGVKEKHRYPAHMGKVRGAIIGLGELKILEAKTRKPEFYEKLGVEDVGADGSLSTGVTLKDSAGTTLAEVIVGNQRPARGNPGQDEVYIRKSGDPRAWLAIGNLSIEKSAGGWLDEDFLEVEPKRVRRLQIIHPDATTLTLEKDAPDELDFTLVNVPAGMEVQSQFVVNNIVSTVASLSLDDVKPTSEIPFDDQAVVIAVFETFDGLEGTVRLLRKDEKVYVKVSASFNGDLIWKPESEEHSKTDNQAEDARDKDNPEKAKTDAPQPERPTIKPEAEVKAEIKALNKRVEEWVYVIPQFRADAILKKPEDLVKQSQ